MAFRRKSASFSSRNQSNRRGKSQDFEKLVHKEIQNPLEPFTLDTLPESMRQVYKDAKWDEIMPVQAQSMPYLLANRDIMVQSRTGSGKTASYLIPLIEKLDLSSRKTQALILVPTRELALQVQKEAHKLFLNSVATLSLYGGVPYTKQLYALNKGVQVVIGTPGRILDHLQRGTLNLDDLEVLVFDEADRMLSIGFYPDMKALQEYLPSKPMLSTLFSATYPANVVKLAEEFLKEPDFLALSQGNVQITEMSHYFVSCKKMEKDRTLVRLLEMENPSSGIIFCNTKATVHYIAQVLQGFGYNAEELSSEISQSRREFVLSRLKNGQTRFLVATDVAARGIDVPLLSHVFLYEPPEDKESYVHRAGRTARAGASGTVISLVDTMEKMELQKIAKFYTIELEQMDTPTKEDVERVASARVVALLEQKKRDLNGLEKERISNYINLVEELTSQDIESEESEDKENLFLLAMLLDEVYQKSLNPEPLKPARNSKSNSRRDRKPREEDSLSSHDSLDSMRDDFRQSQREKRGNRPERGARNANNRNEAPRRERSFGDRDRSERSGSREDSRYERKKPNRGFDPRHDNNDDDIFAGLESPRRAQSESRGYADRNSFDRNERSDRGQRSFGERSERSFGDRDRSPRPQREGRGFGDRERSQRPSREERFENASKGRTFGRNADRPFSRDREDRPSYNADSFPRKRRNENFEEQDDYVVFKDENFFVLPDSNARKTRSQEPRSDRRQERPRKASSKKTGSSRKARR